MSDPITPIKFCAWVDQVQTGDDEIRLVLSVCDSLADIAAAVEMSSKRNRVLRIGVFAGADTDELAEFRGAIAQLKAAIKFRAKRPPSITLDVPASDGLSAMLLVGHTEEMVRFEVWDEGDKPPKEKKPRKPKEKTPFGELWQELLHRNMGFEFIPGVKESLEEMRGVAYEEPHQLMRKVFGVKSLSVEIGRDQIYARWPPNEYPTVGVLVEQALDRIENRQAKAQPANNGVTKSVYVDEGNDFPPEFDPDYEPDIFCDDLQQNA